jgi:hypothetical protein
MRTVLFPVFAALLVGSSAMAIVPTVMNYQGRLEDSGGNPLDGEFSLTFSIYDVSSGGSAIWTETHPVVIVTDGLFEVRLGTSNPIHEEDFESIPRYLGVSVDGGAELAPRTLMTTAPFSFRSAFADNLSSTEYLKRDDDTASGAMFFDGERDDNAEVEIRTWPGFHDAEISLYDNDAVVPSVKALLSSYDNGWLRLYDEDANLNTELVGGSPSGTGYLLLTGNELAGGALLAARTFNTTGGELVLSDSGGIVRTRIIGVNGGDSSVSVPQSSINPLEMIGEPGLVHGFDEGYNIEITSTTMQDLEVVTVTTQWDGFIYLIGTCWILVGGTTSAQGGYVQIDETAGGDNSTPHYMFAGNSSYHSSSASYYWPVTVQRVYEKPAGTHTFRLEARRWTTVGEVYAWFPKLTAIFLPTSYGFVEGTATASEVADFEEATLIDNSGILSSEHNEIETEPQYHVDLRELEMKATEARLNAEKARMDALKAEMELERARKLADSKSRREN